MAERRQFTQGEKEYMWDKAKPVAGLNGSYAQDAMGNIIKKQDYGNYNSPYGWDGDHSKPLSKNGSYHKNNIHALQSEQNRVAKNDQYPYHYNQEQAVGISAQSFQQATPIDLRSSNIKSGSLHLTPNGNVDMRSSAVKSGEVFFKQDGSVDKRCSAYKNGSLLFKK